MKAIQQKMKELKPWLTWGETSRQIKNFNREDKRRWSFKIAKGECAPSKADMPFIMALIEEAEKNKKMYG